MQHVDGLFLSQYDNMDLWHNDAADGRVSTHSTIALRSEADQTWLARIARHSATLDGDLYDMPRFFSWLRHGNTRHHQRYNAFTTTHLSGSLYKSLALRHGYEVVHVNVSNREVVARLGERYAPRYVFFSTTFMTETHVILEVMQNLRAAFPGVPIVLGGLILVELERGLAPALFQRFLQVWRADAYVVTPRGEEAFLEILAHEPSQIASLDLPSTYVRDGRTYKKCAREERGLSLDHDYVHWSRFDGASLYRTVHTRTARSCAFKCAFCSYPANQGPLTLANTDTLEAELAQLKQLSNVSGIVFVDDTFNVPLGRFKQLLRVLAKFDFEWYSFFRAQYCDRETADLMKAAGCRGVFLGLESLDDQVLKNMNKAATAREYRYGVEQLKRVGIKSHANFIIGYPGDRAEYAQRIVDFCDELDVEFMSVTPFYCSPATPVGQERERWKIDGLYWEWKHETMTSDEAKAIELDLMRACKRTVFMSELSSRSFWTELLCYSNGWSSDDLREVMRFYLRCGSRPHTRAELEGDPELARVRAIVARHPMQAPPDAELLGVPPEPHDLPRASAAPREHAIVHERATGHERATVHERGA